jgi:hypothetical protein
MNVWSMPGEATDDVGIDYVVEWRLYLRNILANLKADGVELDFEPHDVESFTKERLIRIAQHHRLLSPACSDAILARQSKYMRSLSQDGDTPFVNFPPVDRAGEQEGGSDIDADWAAGVESSGAVFDKSAHRVAAGVTTPGAFSDLNRWVKSAQNDVERGVRALKRPAPVVIAWVDLIFFQQLGVWLARRTASDMRGTKQSRNLWWGEAGTGKSAMVHHLDHYWGKDNLSGDKHVALVESLRAAGGRGGGGGGNTGGAGGADAGGLGTSVFDAPRPKRPRAPIVVKVASTGVAASLINGSTVHATFGVKPGSSGPEMVAPPRNITGLAKVFQHVEVLVVDEVSIAGKGLLGQADRRAQQIRTACGHGKPRDSTLGGIPSTVVIGDFYQLDPVSTLANDAVHQQLEKPKRKEAPVDLDGAVELLKAAQSKLDDGPTKHTGRAPSQRRGPQRYSRAHQKARKAALLAVNAHKKGIGISFQRRGEEVLSNMDNVVILMEGKRQKNADPRFVQLVRRNRYGNIGTDDHAFLNGVEMQLALQHDDVKKCTR